MNSIMTKYLYLGVAVTIIFSLNIYAEGLPVFNKNELIIRLDDDNSIHRLDPNTSESRKIYHSDEYKITDLSVAPNNLFIAFIEELRPPNEQGASDAMSPYRLTVIDGIGNLITRIDKNARRYVWSPDGEKLAFLTFDPCDNDYEFRCPSGAWILDLESRDMIRIAERATEINWAIHDSSVYLYDSGRVLKWDMPSGQLRQENYKDIYFSPDGKFYLMMWKDEGRPIQLYETQSNSKVMDIKIYKQLLPAGDNSEIELKGVGELWSSHDLNPPHGWVFNSGHYLLFTKSNIITELEGNGPIKCIKSQTTTGVKNYIYDPSSKRAIRDFDGFVGSWVGDGRRIIVEKDNNVLIQDIP